MTPPNCPMLGITPTRYGWQFLIKPTHMIKIKYENCWYGYQGRDGYALYVNGKKMHKGLFVSVTALRQYWNDYRLMLIADIVPFQYQ